VQVLTRCYHLALRPSWSGISQLKGGCCNRRPSSTYARYPHHHYYQYFILMAILSWTVGRWLNTILDSQTLAQSSILSWTVARWHNIFILVFVTRVHTTNMPRLLTPSLWLPRARARYLKRRMMGWVPHPSPATPPTPAATAAAPHAWAWA
jgi:hypothetical protein